jgi:tripartite-type tricarboxylate transporter receptor subunit TctC
MGAAAGAVTCVPALSSTGTSLSLTGEEQATSRAKAANRHRFFFICSSPKKSLLDERTPVGLTDVTILPGQPGFDAQADFEPIAMVGILPLVYVTLPSNPVNNIQDLLAAARSKPDALNTAVSTTTCRMAHELFKMRGGAVMMPIDFKGSAQSITAVLGGHVGYMVDTIASLQAQVASGQLKALGVTSLASSRLLPGVKSIAEQGVAGYELVGWTVIFAPKGIPAEAAQTLASNINKTLERADVQAKLLQMGVDSQLKSGAELKSFIASEKEKWGKLIGAAGLKPA